MTRPYGGGCSVEGGSNLNVKVGQIYLTINIGIARRIPQNAYVNMKLVIGEIFHKLSLMQFSQISALMENHS